MAGRILLTRPEGRNEALAARLEAQGLSPLVMPALRLSPLDIPRDQFSPPSDHHLLMFVSGFAARCYLDLLRRHGFSWPFATLAATVGQGSAEVLLHSGLPDPAHVIYPPAPGGNNDSEALLALLDQRCPKLGSVLVVRGGTGRNWLSEQLQGRGVQVAHLAVYQRQPAEWLSSDILQLRRAYSASRQNIVLLTSSESIDAMVLLLKPAGLLGPWMTSRFLVVHPRQALHLERVALEAGLSSPAVVKVCSPNDDAIFRAVMALAS